MKTTASPLFAALLALVLTACGTTPAAPTRDSSDSSSDAVREVVGVQELRREVAELRDIVEVQRNELEKLRERQRQLYDDLDHRVRQSERGAAGERGSAAQTPQQGYGQAQDDDTGGRQSESGQQDAASRSGDQEIPAEQDQAGGQQDDGQTGQAPQEQQTAAMEQSPDPDQERSSQNAVASAEEQSAYDNAFELLKQSRYNDAIIDFRALISEFPSGALVDDAQYWIGEAYYVTRDFENALDAFQTVVDRYPDSQRVPEALLKLGYVQAELGQNEAARRTLNQVISEYPGSRVAISAETRLSKIR